MIEESYVSFDTARMLKEAGFHIPCIKVYNKHSKNLAAWSYPADSNQHTRYYSAPTQALVARWLREVHKIHVYAIQTNLPYTEPQTTKWEWGYVIDNIDDPNSNVATCEMDFASYEAAFEAGIAKCLKLIKK